MIFSPARLGRYELRRFRGPLPKLALIFVLLVPLLYSAIYLSANWDPYGRLDRLPVAIVDLDRPATVDGPDGEERTVHAGPDLVDRLMEDQAFDWRATDAEEADEGLADGRYFMTMTIPASFSGDLVSGATLDPERAEIYLRRDDANGFVVGSITSKAQDSVALAVDQAAVDAYFSAVFANLDTIRSGMADARDGASRLADGASAAHDGAGQLAGGADDARTGADALADGAEEASAGASELASGAGQVSDGAVTARDGAQQLDAGLGQLLAGSSSLAEGADQVAAGTSQLSGKVVPVLDVVLEELPAVQDSARTITSDVAALTEAVSGASGSVSTDLASLATDLDQIQQDHPELADDPTWQRLVGTVGTASGRAEDVAGTAATVAGTAVDIDAAVQSTGDLTTRVQQARDDLTALDEGAHQVATGAHSLHDGVADARKGSATLYAGLGTLADGASQVADGATALDTGVSRLADGAHQLDDGLGELATGAHDLDDGLARVDDGAAELADGLADGVERLPVLTQDEQDRAAQVLSSPADVRMTVDHPATYYGRGLAPMFFAIALWVFGISVFLVVRPVAGRLLAGRAHPLRLSLTAWYPVAAIAVAGGLIMVGVVWATLGLAPVRPLSLLALTVFGALCFSSIAHLLRTALGTVASAITLVWLVLQLPTSGGTYPAELLPPFLGAIAPAMPMTYLIDAFRVVISGGETARLVTDVVVLVVITVTAVALCGFVVLRRQRFAMKDLHPPLVAP
ncbi:YhgE/Pip domain-containing protein [Ornithinimicrobium avium]|uniref:YhgE/Pip domain-containing protein n=1 Tax=Ornithinimicrobium avium TaxID=2283195 RepID=UPI001D1935A1|nr:YhgE/Pip domain-containing protein [Ornithinimicrobium avium]